MVPFQPLGKKVESVVGLAGRNFSKILAICVKRGKLKDKAIVLSDILLLRQIKDYGMAGMSP
jgi:hypothetical protein